MIEREIVGDLGKQAKKNVKVASKKKLIFFFFWIESGVGVGWEGEV